ncbi:MAG: DUF47 domain-containing protein [Bdellovibrionia bacterium]
MLKSILPKEEKYFDRFDQMADLLSQASAMMLSSMEHPAEASAKAMALSEVEIQADQITHTILEYLHKTFITPFERNDIHTLVFKMAKGVELLAQLTCFVADYRLSKEVPSSKNQMAVLLELAQLVNEQVNLVSSAIPGLRKIKEPDPLVQICAQIHQVKYRARVLLRKISVDLFETDDVKLMMKYRDLVSTFNQLISCCVEIANRIEVIVLEYA